jgi:hypothetical protein
LLYKIKQAMRTLLKSDLTIAAIAPVERESSQPGMGPRRPSSGPPPPHKPKAWEIILAALFALLIVWFFEAPSNKQSDIASCETDKPVNVVMCVDLGVGHHELRPQSPN